MYCFLDFPQEVLSGTFVEIKGNLVPYYPIILCVGVVTRYMLVSSQQPEAWHYHGDQGRVQVGLTAMVA